MNQEFTESMHRFIENRRLRNQNSSTAIHYQSDLEQFGHMVDKEPRVVSRADVTEFVTNQLTQGLSPVTVNRRLASLSSFFEFLADEAGDDYWPNPVVWRLHRVKQGNHLPRDLPEAVAQQFWQAVSCGPVRDQAIVALMLDVGLRVGEVAALTAQDFEASPEPTELSSLRVQGKGNKERRVWLVPETANLVRTWLTQRPAVESEALFITRRKGGFTVRGLQDRVKHYTLQAGLPLNQVSCHRLRHTFARRMAESRMPLPSLSHWLGHSQLQTTQIYIDGANPEIRADYQAAMARLSEPAERPNSQVTPSISSTSEPSPVQPAPLTAATIDSKLPGLPAWLGNQIVAFIQAKQARWQPYHRRAQALRWLSELRRIWTWLLTERQLTGFADLSRRDLSAYLAHLQDRGLAASTLNFCLTVFWSFLRFVEERDQPIAPGLYRVPRPQTPDQQPRPLTEAELTRLEQAVLTATAQARPEVAALDRSWFFILSDGGLRISELVTLTVDDWQPHTQILHIRHGKGGYQRQVPLTTRAAEAIAAHLNYRQPVARHEPLLSVQERVLTPSYVRRRLHRFAAQAQVFKVTPHRLRHTFATRLLNTGKIPITTLQKLMGHRLIDTTMRYAALYNQTIQSDYQAAMNSLQSGPDLDQTLWKPTIEAAFQNEPEWGNAPELTTIANCM
jgi:site-specific recombinase XerD